MKLDDCNVLITGASAGIGREFARQLAGRARSLILVARREDRLADLRDELQKQHPNLAVQIRQVDLADPAQLQELMEWFDRENINVDLLINNAGLGDSGPFATGDPIRNEQITLVNVVALTSLARHVLPQMIAKHRGGILNVSSSAGFLPIPGSAVYSATKAYVKSFSVWAPCARPGPKSKRGYLCCGAEIGAVTSLVAAARVSGGGQSAASRAHVEMTGGEKTRR